MRETVPYLALSVEGSNHGNSWQDCVEPAVAITTFVCPNSADEARFIEPRFVDIYDSFALLKQRQKSRGILLPLDKNPRRVGIRVQLLGS